MARRKAFDLVVIAFIIKIIQYSDCNRNYMIDVNFIDKLNPIIPHIIYHDITIGFLNSVIRFLSLLIRGPVNQQPLIPDFPHTFPAAPILNTTRLTTDQPHIFGIQLQMIRNRIIIRQFRYSIILFPQPKQLPSNLQQYTSSTNLKAFNVLKLTKLLKIYLGSKQFKLSSIQYKKCLIVSTQNMIEIFYSSFWQMLKDISLYPSLDILFIELTLIGYPVTSCNVSINRDRWSWSIQFKFLLRQMEKFYP